jgi:hypothetical protein
MSQRIFGLQIGHHSHDAVVEAADRIAVRLGSRDLLRADQPGRARLVHDHELLAHIVGHFLRHDPRGDIDSARRGQRNDHLDRPVGISRLRDGGRTGKDRMRQNEQMKHAHPVSPCELDGVPGYWRPQSFQA